MCFRIDITHVFVQNQFVVHKQNLGKHPLDIQTQLTQQAPKILFAVFQTENRANGGVQSISHVIDSINSKCVVVTQMETTTNERWRGNGHLVEVFRLTYSIGDDFKKSSISKKLVRLWSILSTNWKTIRLIRKHKLDVLHCNDPAPYWHVVPAARLTGTPVVLNLRDTISANENVSVTKYSRKFRYSDLVLVLSNEMADFYQKLVGQTAINKLSVQLRVIYSIVNFNRMTKADLAERNDIRVGLGIPDSTFAIGYVAAFNDKKNQLEFIRKAGSALRERVRDAKVYFIGDFCPEESHYASQCLAETAERNLQQNLVFVGFSESIEKWYQALDLVIVPTRKEGMARCMIESLACGTPVVSFDVCSAKEILKDNDCGCVVKQGDYQSFVEAIERIARDPAERLRLGCNGCLAAKKFFQKPDIIRRYTNVYRGLIKKTRSVDESAEH